MAIKSHAHLFCSRANHFSPSSSQPCLTLRLLQLSVCFWLVLNSFFPHSVLPNLSHGWLVGENYGTRSTFDMQMWPLIDGMDKIIPFRWLYKCRSIHLSKLNEWCCLHFLITFSNGNANEVKLTNIFESGLLRRMLLIANEGDLWMCQITMMYIFTVIFNITWSKAEKVKLVESSERLQSNEKYRLQIKRN